MDDHFYRIRRLPPYVFAEVNAMKAAARARGEDIIDLGMGNPDGAPPPHVIDKLCRSRGQADRPPLFGQPRHPRACARPRPLITSAASASTVDPDTRSDRHLGLEGRASPTSPRRSPRPGDVVLAPNPSYPIHTFGFIIAGAAIRSIPAAPGEDFFDRLAHADALHRAAAQGAGGRLSRPTRPLMSPTSPSTSGWSPSRASMT